jgi:isoaspartyl peptidase/L-asparaginase-like protein (Ntn-hydrolase superfamily)
MTPTLLIHGGAGAIERGKSTPEHEAALRSALDEALAAGIAVLEANGPALDATIAAVRVMEESPLFNAGRGAALTSEGTIEHDASVMDGADRRAGAVSATKRIRSPVLAARAVMERSPHVHLTGDGAEAFARAIGLEIVPEWWFFTPERQAALLRVQAAERGEAGANERDRHGTVGAVALDAGGHLAAATSTGGRANQWPGRVGDTPVLGAGTYADDRTLAYSGTGHGESFMRLVLGHRLACLVELAGMSLAQASARVLDELGEMGGTGGFVALAATGEAVMPHNTPGMYRGIARAGRRGVAIFGDETIDA